MPVRMMKPAEYKQAQQLDYGTEAQHEVVKQIIAAVAEQGDEALRYYTKQFDRMEIDDFLVKDEEIRAAYSEVDQAFLEALRNAAQHIRLFHEKQKRLSWQECKPDGSILGQLIRPIKRVGLYVPGGTAAYPSSVLMNVIPAQVAGVREIAVATPPSTAGQPGINPYILVACAELGIQEIYRVGGAQAVAALAYGTESIPAVDKICGPGNIYVALAKRYVYGKVDIDSIAGPSDITVLADEHADPSYVAADLLSQAEHDVLAQAVLVTNSATLAEQVKQELARQLETLPRKDIAAQSLADNGALIIAESMDECVEMVNRIAPEHLELLVEEPFALLGRIENAGAIFLGPYSSEPVGDYYAGPNHILPTGGTARYASPLNVDDFLKKSSLIYYSKAALAEAGKDIMTLARGEGLEAHARAIAIRFEKEGI